MLTVRGRNRCRFPSWRSVVPLAALFASIAAPPATAHACTFAAVSLYQSYPGRESTGVPTNVVAFAYTDGSSGPLLLRRSDGTPVPSEVTLADPSGLDLRPLAELEPFTNYELVYGTDRVPFQTGAGPADAPAELAPPDFSATRVSYLQGTCGRLEFVCGATTAAAGTLLEVRAGDEVLLSDAVLEPDVLLSMAPAYGRLAAADECLSVRARDVRGRRSAPLTLCGDEVASLELGELAPSIDCDQALAIYEGDVPDPSVRTRAAISPAATGDCSFSPAPPGATARPWAFASALALLGGTLKLRRRTR
jgi:hypothetical protein